jgi:hypothetical protein
MIRRFNFEIARILSNPAPFSPGLPVARFPIVKKYFFIKTNYVKGFFLHQRGTPCCLKPLKNDLQKTAFLGQKWPFQVSGVQRCSNVLKFYTLSIRTNIIRFRPRRC